MCFSATASFTSSAGLGLVAVASIGYSKTVPQRVLACMPLMFAIQQFCEGVLWLALMHSDFIYLRSIFMHLFLVFAQVVWPVFIPFMTLLFEDEPARKKILQGLVGLGVLTALYFGICQIFYHSEVSITGHHLKYVIDYPFANKWYSGITYIVAAAISPLISSDKRLRILGYILGLSYLLTFIMYKEYLISVWCFFGAILSVFSLFFIILRRGSSGLSFRTA
jgi:hypothetical protein